VYYITILKKIQGISGTNVLLENIGTTPGKGYRDYLNRIKEEIKDTISSRVTPPFYSQLCSELSFEQINYNTSFQYS